MLVSAALKPESRLESLIAALVVLPAEPADFEIEGAPSLPAQDRPVLLAATASGADWLLTGDLRPLPGDLPDLLGHDSDNALQQLCSVTRPAMRLADLDFQALRLKRVLLRG